MRRCTNCDETFEGRSDKIFCNEHCRSQFNHALQKEKPLSRFRAVEKQLKLNRNILKKFNRSGKSIVRQEELFAEGFKPKYFTGYWKNKLGHTYLFCYEYGFLSTYEKGTPKYVLVKWQAYMN
ncbi:MAG: hypothetical protein ACI943_002955 [Gammaproteobacteria bacterium]|jgi:hypothetical protein